jgi:hypothetical protein
MDGPNPYTDAVCICFGEAQGQMEAPPNSGNYVLTDTHGAGAQRNDTKTGLAANYPQYHGPQGDVVYGFNYSRCVRDFSNTTVIPDLEEEKKKLIKIVDVLGREVKVIPNTPLFYLFDDGTAEKRIIIIN